MDKYLEANAFDLPRAALGNTAERVVTLASDYQLCRQSHVHRLAIAMVERKIPRRRLADWIATILAHYEGRIIWASGVEYHFAEGEIYKAFNVEGDLSQRWVGDFYKFALNPPIQLAQGKVIARLRFIDLAFRIAFPERAELIAK